MCLWHPQTSTREYAQLRRHALHGEGTAVFTDGLPIGVDRQTAFYAIHLIGRPLLGYYEIALALRPLHEFKDHAKWLENVKPSMKSNARLVIIERDPEKTGSGWGHFMKNDEILAAVKRAKFDLVRIETFLKNDNIFIFRIPTDDQIIHLGK